MQPGIRIASWVATLAVLAGTLSLTPAASATSMTDDTLAVCMDPGPIEAVLLPQEVTPSMCDLVGRIVVDGEVGLTVGPAGTGVTATAHMATGGASELGATTAEDGTVTFTSVGEDGETASESATSPNSCDDDASNLHRWKERDNHKWFLKLSTKPGYLDRDKTINAIRDAGTNIVQQKTNCGGLQNDEVSADISYQGTTSTGPNFSNGACSSWLSKDNKNVVAFGSISEENGVILARTCIWTRFHFGKDELQESDVRLNDGDGVVWFNSYPSGCNNRFHIESVMTHERGHTFGIAHVSPDQHKWLTMSRTALPCSTNHASLGWGDVKGLRSLY